MVSATKHVTIGVNSSKSICRIGPIIGLHEVWGKLHWTKATELRPPERRATLTPAGVQSFSAYFLKKGREKKKPDPRC